MASTPETIPPSRQIDEIPGPPGHLIHGNTIEYRAGRLAFLQRMASTYGNIVRYRFGCHWCYLINDAAIAREVFAQWDTIDNGFNSDWLYLDQSFLGANGRARIEPRRRVHSAMCPRSLLEQYGAMARRVQAEVESWQCNAERDILDDLLHLGVDLVAQAVFGQEARRCIGPVVDFLADLEMLTGAFTTEDRAQRLSFSHRRAAFVELDEVVTRAIAQWLERSGRPPCILRQLLDCGVFNERALVHEVCVILLSNVSAPAAATWALGCLAAAPRARSRLEAELDATLGGRGPTAAQLRDLPELDRVVKEALRLCPPLALIGREVIAPWSCGPLHLDTGSRLHISPYLLHRDPAVWSQPLQFRPERFDPHSPLHRPGAMSSFMPFGHGIRRCIGDHFAQLQIKLIVATVVRSVRVDQHDGAVLKFDTAPLGALVVEDLEARMQVRPRMVEHTQEVAP